MKKLLLLFGVLLSMATQAQYPLTGTQGDGSTMVKSVGAAGAYSGFLWEHSFADTAAANAYTVTGASAGFLMNIPGFVIRCVNDLWVRSDDMQYWIKFNIGITAWSPNGNTFGAVKSFGTNDAYDLPFITGGVERARFINSLGQFSSAKDILANGVTVGQGHGSISTNTATGFGALNANTTGFYNTAFGWAAMYSNTTGGGNTALGYGALNNGTTHSSNVAIGFSAMNNSSTSNANVAIGSGAGYSITTGKYNTYVGTSGAGAVGGADSNNTVIGSRYAINGSGGVWLFDGQGNARAVSNSTGAWKLPYYGIGSFTGTATKALNVDASGNIIEGTVPTGTVTNVTGTEPVQVATGTTTPVISMKKASATDSGWVSTGTQAFGGTKTFSTVGIGTTTPAKTLNVVGGDIQIGASLTTGNFNPTSYRTFTIGTDLTSAALQLGGGGTGVMWGGMYANVGGLSVYANGLPISFETPTQRMLINTGGNVSIGNSNNSYKMDVSGTARFTGATEVGNGSTTTAGSQLLLGHTGVAQIKFNSIYGNYPFTMGAESNGYDFYIRQSNGGQGQFTYDFGTITSILYQNSYQYITDHYENILTGKWLTAFSGSGSAGAYYGLKNQIFSDGTSAKYDAFRIERAINGGYYPATDDPIVSLFNGSSTGTVTAHNRYVARFNRLGYLGIGTLNTYAVPASSQQAALTINQGVRTGTTTTTGTTAMQVKTVGSSTSVVCLGNGNGENAMGLLVGSKITANGVSRTITAITSAQGFTVDAAVDWSNGGSGYSFTFVNPYIALVDSTTKYFMVDGTGNVGIGTAAPTKPLHIKNLNPQLELEQTTSGQKFITRIGNNTGTSNSQWNLYDSTANKIRLSVHNSIGTVIIGNTLTPYSQSSLYVADLGTNGANIDAQDDSTKSGYSNIETMAADYTNGYGTAIRHWSNSGYAINASTVAGFGSKNMSLFDLTDSVNIIRVNTNHSLRIATNNIERMVIDSVGKIKFDNYGSGTFTGTATKSLNVDASGNIIEGPVSVLAQTTDRQTAQTAAVTLAAATVGAADASYLISANILVTTSTLHNFTATVTYTDEGNTSRTVTMQFSTIAGAFVTAMTNAQGTVPYEGVPLHIRAKAATTITLATAGTFTGVAYNMEESIRQIN